MLGPVRTLMAGSPSNVLVMNGCADADPGVSVAIACAEATPSDRCPRSEPPRSATNNKDGLEYAANLFIFFLLKELPIGSRL